MDNEIVTKKLNEIFYNKLSLIELFYVKKTKGKLVISFIQERSGFESVMDPEDKSEIIYTVQSKKEGLRFLRFSLFCFLVKRLFFDHSYLTKV